MEERDRFIKNLVGHGIDADIAASMYDRTVKKDNEKKKKRIPPSALGREKKHVGRLEITEICHTCGNKFTHSIITMLDPNKPQNTEVPVSVCRCCVAFYRTLSQDQLINLVILKDHPDIGFRMLSNKQQVKIALTSDPYELLSKRSEVEPAQDNRHLKPQY